MGRVSSVLIEWKERPAVLVLVSDITERKINEENLSTKYARHADRSL